MSGDCRDSVSARAFRPIHAPIRISEKCSGAAAGVIRHPDTDRHSLPGHSDRAGEHRVADLLGDRERLADCSAGKHYYELVSTEAPDDTVRSCFTENDSGHRSQHLIADEMAVLVVDRLEPIDVDHEHGKWQALSVCPLDRLAEHEIEFETRGDAGDGVIGGLTAALVTANAIPSGPTDRGEDDERRHMQTRGLGDYDRDDHQSERDQLLLDRTVAAREPCEQVRHTGEHQAEAVQTVKGEAHSGIESVCRTQDEPMVSVRGRQYRH